MAQLATLCYIKANQQTLMLHRVKKKGDYHQGKWNGLGGKFEPGETPEECVIREVLEESGLEIQEPALKGILTFPMFDGVKDWVVFVFVAGKFSGEIKSSPEGELKWIQDPDLAALNMWEGDQIFLSWLEGNHFFSGKFVYEKGQFISHEVVFYD